MRSKSYVKICVQKRNLLLIANLRGLILCGFKVKIWRKNTHLFIDCLKQVAFLRSKYCAGVYCQKRNLLLIANLRGPILRGFKAKIWRKNTHLFIDCLKQVAFLRSKYCAGVYCQKRNLLLIANLRGPILRGFKAKIWRKNTHLFIDCLKQVAFLRSKSYGGFLPQNPSFSWLLL